MAEWRWGQVFGAEVADICGREEQLPAVTHAIVHLLHGDALRAHNIFQWRGGNCGATARTSRAVNEDF